MSYLNTAADTSGEYLSHTSALTTGLQSNSAAFSSGTSYINALLDGISWTGTTGSAATVTYGFGSSNFSGTLFNATQQAATMAVMQQYSDVANLNFTQVSSGAKLTFSNTVLGGDVAGLTTTQYSGTTTAFAEVQMDTSVTSYNVGSFGYLVLLHEIGHALGLKHPGNYGSSDAGPYLSGAEDVYDSTLMSYNPGPYANDSNYPTTPMIYDIAALQYLYGANTSYRSGNDTYTFTTAKTAYTFWDGGGTDTFDASAQTGSVTLDLREGFDLVTRVGSGSYWNAYGTNIENALGGSGSDNIFGNAISNTLEGGSGNDLIRGGKSDDFTQGNQGADTVAGDLGNDLVRGGKDNDFVYGGQGIDTIAGDLGNDYVSGDRDNDYVYGGQGNDSLYGGDGNDILYGDKDNDTLDGGAGNDTFFFGAASGADVISSFDNAGVAAGDLIQVLSNANGTGLTSVAGVLAAIVYSASGAVLDLGGGHSVSILGVASGSLTADDFSLV